MHKSFSIFTKIILNFVLPAFLILLSIYFSIQLHAIFFEGLFIFFGLCIVVGIIYIVLLLIRIFSKDNLPVFTFGLLLMILLTIITLLLHGFWYKLYINSEFKKRSEAFDSYLNNEKVKDLNEQEFLKEKELPNIETDLDVRCITLISKENPKMIYFSSKSGAFGKKGYVYTDDKDASKKFLFDENLDHEIMTNWYFYQGEKLEHKCLTK